MDPLNRRQFLALAAAAAGVTAGCAGMGGGGSVKSGSGQSTSGPVIPANPARRNGS